jgi:hypothetical protein
VNELRLPPLLDSSGCHVGNSKQLGERQELVQQQVTYTVMASVMALAFSSGSQMVNSEWWFPHPPKPFETPVVFQAAGPNVASIQGTVDQYRLALGDPLNGNAPGPLAAGRREINWDGGGNNNTTSPGPTPFDVFLNTRGAQMTTPGSGFVQAPPSGIVDLTGNASYADIFKTFSPLRLFAVLDSTLTRVKFFVPGTNGAVAATTRGFGAVFTDVDQPDGAADFGWKDKASTFIEYYDVSGRLLFSSAVPASPGDGGLSFLGIVFTDPRLARVRIYTGNAELGKDDSRRKDVVVMDDFLYGEPQAIQ